MIPNLLEKQLSLYFFDNCSAQSNIIGPFKRSIDAIDFDTKQFFSKNDGELNEDEVIMSKYFNYLHGWVPSNPSKKDVVEHLNEVYVDELHEKCLLDHKDTEEIANYSNNNNNKDKDIESYNSFKIINSDENVVIVGNRGCGKTTFLNYWFNNFSYDIQEKNKIIWSRIDASKIYRHWDVFDNKIKENKLATYHKIHLVYVVLSYSGHFDFNTNVTVDDLFKEIVNEIKVPYKFIKYDDVGPNNTSRQLEDNNDYSNCVNLVFNLIGNCIYNNVKDIKENKQIIQYYTEKTDFFIEQVLFNNLVNECIEIYDNIEMHLNLWRLDKFHNFCFDKFLH
jgi:GTPase SAR1 family protein